MYFAGVQVLVLWQSEHSCPPNIPAWKAGLPWQPEQKAGVPLKILYDVINESSGQSRSVQVFAAAKPFKGDYEPGFAAELMHKDLGLALNLGKEERVPLPLGALSHQIFTHLLTLGLGRKDTGVIFKVMEDLLGIQMRL